MVCGSYRKTAEIQLENPPAYDALAEHEMNDNVGEGLGHNYDGLTGLGVFVEIGNLGLRSSDSLQPRL